MREIKFRAWDREKEKMYEVENICFYGHKSVTLQYNPVIKKAIEDIEIMQCTGMKDSTGKEIYEGDIIKINEEECYSGEHVGDVCFLDVGGCWYINGVRDGLADINRNYWIDVIGNIYENPELLGGADDEN